MPAARPDQWRQRDAIERDKAVAGQTRQPGKCLMVRIENHSSSDGSRLTPSSRKFHRRDKEWNFLPFRGYSDFFTLDPNLASALRRICAGVFSAAKAQPERGLATPEDGFGGETGVE